MRTDSELRRRVWRDYYRPVLDKLGVLTLALEDILAPYFIDTLGRLDFRDTTECRNLEEAAERALKKHVLERPRNQERYEVLPEGVLDSLRGCFLDVRRRDGLEEICWSCGDYMTLSDPKGTTCLECRRDRYGRG